jgi:hypothetical protein
MQRPMDADRTGSVIRLHRRADIQVAEHLGSGRTIHDAGCCSAGAEVRADPLIKQLELITCLSVDLHSFGREAGVQLLAQSRKSRARSAPTEMVSYYHGCVFE